MANRAMQAKVERAQRQARELARAEYSKPFYAGNATLKAGEAVTRENNALVARFLAKGGKINRAPSDVKAVHRRVVIRRERGFEVVKDKVVRWVYKPVERSVRGGVPMGDATPGRLSLSCAAPARGIGLINRR